MANLRARYLYPKEIDAIVTPLLTEAFKDYGYKDKSIKEDETFDGDPIIRVTAEVAQPVPAEQLAKTLNRIHNALREKDEERFVFLSAPGPAILSGSGDEDEDEDI
jgi:hypothetical protein